LTKFLFQAHDHGHDRAGAAGADAAQPHLDDAAGDVQHFDAGAVQLQRGADLLDQGARDAGISSPRRLRLSVRMAPRER
jgi:hypothetical protein